MMVVTETPTYHSRENIFMLVVTKISSYSFPLENLSGNTVLVLLLGVFRVELVILCFSCKSTGSRDRNKFFFTKISSARTN
jgi:hypothetical protein